MQVCPDYAGKVQDSLTKDNRANKQVESEKAVILQELNTLRAHVAFGFKRKYLIEQSYELEKKAATKLSSTNDWNRGYWKKIWKRTLDLFIATCHHGSSFFERLTKEVVDMIIALTKKKGYKIKKGLDGLSLQLTSLEEENLQSTMFSFAFRFSVKTLIRVFDWFSIQGSSGAFGNRYNTWCLDREVQDQESLPAATSPTADSPGYIPESDPERDPEEDDKEDPEEDPADYPTNKRDDDDDDDDDDEEEDEEVEEHLAPADYTIVALPAVDYVPSKEETEPFETDEYAATPPSPPSPLIPYSSPLPQIPSPPLPIPSPPPNSPTHIKVPESCLPLRKRMRFAAPTPNHEAGESSAAGAARQDGPAVARKYPYSVARGDLYVFVNRVDVAPGHPMSRDLDYGITDTWDDLETTIMYGMIEDAQDDQSLLRARVKLLYRDMPVHHRLAIMIEKGARMAREAWGLSMDASDYAPDHRRQGVIKELLAADHQRQVQLTKVLKLLKGLHTQMAKFQRQHGPAKGSAQPDAPGEAGSSS
ncbi:hypothetical protein Tco_0827636 [Tanacetum coccineum]